MTIAQSAEETDPPMATNGLCRGPWQQMVGQVVNNELMYMHDRIYGT